VNFTIGEHVALRCERFVNTTALPVAVVMGHSVISQESWPNIEFAWKRFENRDFHGTWKLQLLCDRETMKRTHHCVYQPIWESRCSVFCHPAPPQNTETSRPLPVFRRLVAGYSDYAFASRDTFSFQVYWSSCILRQPPFAFRHAVAPVADAWWNFHKAIAGEFNCRVFSQRTSRNAAVRSIELSQFDFNA